MAAVALADYCLGIIVSLSLSSPQIRGCAMGKLISRLSKVHRKIPIDIFFCRTARLITAVVAQ